MIHEVARTEEHWKNPRQKKQITEAKARQAVKAGRSMHANERNARKKERKNPCCM